MDDLKQRWDDAKKKVERSPSTAAELISASRRKNNSVLYFQYGNIIILTATLAAICFFFFGVVALRSPLSKVGMWLMLCGLATRIVIEVYSVIKFKTIVFERDLSHTTNDALNYFNYRKKVHGPLTITIVALYVLGFYLLSPEFSIHIRLRWMIMMHVSFLAGAIFLVWVIKKGIQKEIQNLQKLVELRKELMTA